LDHFGDDQFSANDHSVTATDLYAICHQRHLNISLSWNVPQFAWMLLFPQLTFEKYAEFVFHDLVPRSRIVGRLRVIDQSMYPRPFLGAEIQDRSVISL
jgi:hypothetical protein